MKQYINDLLAISSSYRSPESKPAATEIPIPEAYQGWDAAAVFQRNLEFLLDRQP
ncbi:hypothetical protein D3C80_1705050 [compost metagenome]